MSEQKLEDEQHSLISVIVITYNSSEFVLETLESVRNQTYRNIELIISDDGSSDDTLNKCNVWVDQNKERFVRVQVLSVKSNTGIPANSNRAIRACRGEWIKGIAGDDLLLPECVAANMDYVTSSQEEMSILFSNMQSFHMEKGNRVVNVINNDVRSQNISGLSSQEQFEALLASNFISAPTGFCKRKLLSQYPYNELYRFAEDYPQWLKLTYNGVKLYFMDRLTVMYRCDNLSATRSFRYYYLPRMHESRVLFFWNEEIKYLGKGHEAIYNRERQEIFLYDLVDIFLSNKKSKWHSFIYRIMKWTVSHFCNFKLESSIK